MACPLPPRASVRDLLTDLLGCTVNVADARPQQLVPQHLAQLAAFRLDDGTVAALCVADLGLACGAGAAIASLPATEAEQARASGQLDGDLAEAYRETVNVLSRLLNTPTTPHVVLDRVHQVPGRVPRDVAAVAREPAERLDYAVALDGYGGGTLTLLAAPRRRRSGSHGDEAGD